MAGVCFSSGSCGVLVEPTILFVLFVFFDCVGPTYRAVLYVFQVNLPVVEKLQRKNKLAGARRPGLDRSDLASGVHFWLVRDWLGKMLV